MWVLSMWRVNKYMNIYINNRVCWRWEENGGLTLANGERIRPIQESGVAAIWTWGLQRSRLSIRLLLGERFWNKAERLTSPEIWVSEKLKLSTEYIEGGKTIRSDSGIKARRVSRGANKERDPGRGLRCTGLSWNSLNDIRGGPSLTWTEQTFKGGHVLIVRNAEPRLSSSRQAGELSEGEGKVLWSQLQQYYLLRRGLACLASSPLCFVCLS